jgi:hypothetical protein
MKYNHHGIPTSGSFEGEIDLPHLQLTVSDHENNPYGIQWMRFDEDCPLPKIVQTIPHVAFEVDNLTEALMGHEVLIEPNSPSPGVLVAFVLCDGAPVEFLQYT